GGLLIIERSCLGNQAHPQPQEHIAVLGVLEGKLLEQRQGFKGLVLAEEIEGFLSRIVSRRGLTINMWSEPETHRRQNQQQQATTAHSLPQNHSRTESQQDR